MPVLPQREMSITRLTAAQASGAVILIRLYVGLIFAGEGERVAVWEDEVWLSFEPSAAILLEA